MSTTAEEQRTLANRLAQQVRADIAASGLRPGDLFMTTNEMVEKYGVSRTIAREAASQLRALGVLEGRQRRGLLVGRPDPVALMGQWVPFYAGSAGAGDLRALAELRYVLEMGAVDLALANASEEQKQQLVALATRFAEVTKAHGQNEEADRIELDFHGLLLTMTANPLVAGMHRVLIDYFHTAPEHDPTWREVSESTVWEHTAIAQALSDGDGELVRSLLRRHLENMLNDFDAGKDDSSDP